MKPPSQKLIEALRLHYKTSRALPKKGKMEHLLAKLRAFMPPDSTLSHRTLSNWIYYKAKVFPDLKASHFNAITGYLKSNQKANKS